MKLITAGHAVEAETIRLPDGREIEYWVGVGVPPPLDFTAYYAATKEGMFSSSPTPPAMIDGGTLVVAMTGFRPQIISGWHGDGVGRLRYIDGCTDTVLVYPPRKGDPCLNFLHLPPGTRQTMHTHPSPRVGLIIKGRGRAVFRDGVTMPLEPGSVFVLPTDEWHCFHTDDDELQIIAWHPDSDWGPSDEVHPMVNRTLVDNVPIRRVEALGGTGDGAGRSDDPLPSAPEPERTNTIAAI